MDNWFYVVFFSWVVVGFAVYLFYKAKKDLESQIKELETDLNNYIDLKKELVEHGRNN